MMKERIALFIATCGPIGRAAVAPGSWASALGLFFVFVVGNYGTLFYIVFLPLCLLAVWASHVASKHFANKDPAMVVIDEVCGILITFILMSLSWPRMLAGFILFRFFDIVKPPPIKLLEKVPLGFGIVLDDLAAGLYANLVLQTLIRYAHL